MINLLHLFHNCVLNLWRPTRVNCLMHQNPKNIFWNSLSQIFSISSWAGGMKKRRRESRKARVDILLIGNQSFHLFLYPLIIFTFLKLSFLARVFFPLYSIPSHLFLPSLASRPPCTRFEWHLKINQDVNNWTKILNCEAFKTFVGKSCRSKCAVSTDT